MQINTDFFNSKSGIELLSKLFLSSGEGIMFFDKSGRIIAQNPRAEQMFGYQEIELLGERVEKLVPDKFKERHVGHREKYTAHPSVRSMGVGRDLQGLRKDGSSFPIELSLSYLQHENETMVVAFITDISLRKDQELKLEEQRKKLEDYTSALENKVRDRTRELEHLNLGLQSQIHERKIAESELKKSLQELRKAEKEILKALDKERELSELKSRFVSMASHEFRTPLTTISSSANLIRKYPESDQQENRTKHIDRIQNSVKNLTSILNDFLSLDKLQSGAMEVRNSSFQLDELIEEVLKDMTVYLKKGQTILCESLPKVAMQTDIHLLKNSLINLLSNASKYSSDQDSITLKCQLKNEKVIITIQDFGIGIPKKEQKNLFQRFFRAANATNIQGTGLGLNIVKNYVDLLKGQICFVSEEGKGSTFEIEIPTRNPL
jgi:PAS domain S-box-containing protein